MARGGDMDLVLLGLLYVWSEARQARTKAAIAEAVLNADPLTLDSMKKRMVDRGLDRVIDLMLLDF